MSAENTNKEKSLTKNSIYFLVYNVFNVLFPFVAGIYVAHILLADRIGEVAAAQNFAQYFVILSFLGIPTYALREIAKIRDNKDGLNKLFSELFIINCISTFTFLAVYTGLIFSISKYREAIALYLIVGLSIALNFLNIEWLFEGFEEFKLISIRNILFKVISFVLLIVLVRGPQDYLWYAAITVIGTAGNYAWNVICAHRFAHFTFHGLNIKRHLKSIAFLVVVNLAIEIYSLLDISMLDLFCANENVAFYTYGSRIQKILLQIINTFTLVLVPRIAYYYSESKIEEFNLLLARTFKIIVLLALPMIVGIYFTADFLIIKIYGDSFAHSATVLKILSLLLLISPTGYLLGSRVLLVVGKENFMVIPVSIGAIVNIVGNAILIPPLKEYGAAFASILSECVVVISYLLLSKKYFKLKGMVRTFLNILISCVFMGLYLFGCSYLPLNGWYVTSLQIVGAILLYIISLLALREKVALDAIQKVTEKLRRSHPNQKIKKE